MSKRSQAWKALEREAALVLGGKRVVRGDWGESDVDVRTEYPALKVDCKYRQSHSHHSLLKGIEKKYCKSIGDHPVLVTKHRGQVGCNVTVGSELFGILLDALRMSDRLRQGDPALFADIAMEVSADGIDLIDDIKNLTWKGKQ